MNLNDGLIGAWVPVLGNTGSVLLDRSTTHAPGDVRGMTWSNNKYNDVLFNNGSFQYAVVPAHARIRRSYPFSFACWARVDGFGASRTLFNTSLRPTGNYAGFGACVKTDGALQLGYGDNGGTAAVGNQRLFVTSGGLVTEDVWHLLAGVFHDHLSVSAWVNDVKYSTTASGTGGAVAHNSNDMSIGGGGVAGGATLFGYLADLRFWNRPISQAEVEALYRGGPGYGLREPERPLWRVAFVPTTGVSGTAAVTLSSATASASGTQTISGTSSTTLAAATSTASGSLTHSGTGAATLAGATASASGTQTCSGTAAVTLAAATCDASGTQGTGTLGTVAVTLAAATSTASGSLAYSGTASATTGPATSTATGTQTCSGSAAAGTGAASCSASGSQTFSGLGSSSLANATATATGSVGGGPISGTVAVTLGAATATISGVVIGIAGPVFAVDCVGYSLRLEAAGETIRVQAETPDTVTTVR